MTGSFATRLFRITFVLAGCYNLAFGFWAAIRPHQFFELFNIAPPRYPEIWSCLGMVVGLYGLLYWHAAWKPENAWPIIAVGLLGKILGPIGMALNIREHWPLRLAMLIVFNDALWWLPFTLFLLRGAAVAKRLVACAPWFCAGLHALGLIAILIVLRPGLVTDPDLTRRAAYIAQHPALWAAGWIVWMMSAASLVTFYAWWGSHLTRPMIATLAVLIAAAGSVCDFAGESLSAIVLVERSSQLLDPTAFNSFERSNLLLTAGVANLLYTVGGIVLMLLTSGLPLRIRAAMWGTWLAGLAMTIATICNYVNGVVATTAILFPLFIGWVAWMGFRGRPS